MAEQLALKLQDEVTGARSPADTGTLSAAEAGAKGRHRRHPVSANRPVRGEPDVPQSLPRGEWRIDSRTRQAGLRGIAQARAALAAAAAEHEDARRVVAA